MKRKHDDERWKSKEVKRSAGRPQRSSEVDTMMGSERTTSRELTTEEQEQIDQKLEMQDLEARPKKWLIRRKDVTQHGLTNKCKGCDALQIWRIMRPHTDDCSSRSETLLLNDLRIKASRETKKQCLETLLKEDCMRKEYQTRGTIDMRA